MMRIFKKVMSAFLASVMCIPATPAYAAESGGSDSYTATLTDTENGIMQFSEACNVFTFVMPEKNIMVRSGFAASDAGNDSSAPEDGTGENSAGTGNRSDGIMYERPHGIPVPCGLSNDGKFWLNK